LKIIEAMILVTTIIWVCGTIIPIRAITLLVNVWVVWLIRMFDKNVEKADMCKCNLYYTTVGMEGAEQEEVDVWIVQHE
jgi:hypothetical protein